MDLHSDNSLVVVGQIFCSESLPGGCWHSGGEQLSGLSHIASMVSRAWQLPWRDMSLYHLDCLCRASWRYCPTTSALWSFEEQVWRQCRLVWWLWAPGHGCDAPCLLQIMPCICRWSRWPHQSVPATFMIKVFVREGTKNGTPQTFLGAFHQLSSVTMWGGAVWSFTKSVRLCNSEYNKPKYL